MNDLAGQESPAKHGRHDQAVLKDVATTTCVGMIGCVDQDVTADVMIFFRIKPVSQRKNRLLH